ncbi:MAG TPA: GIY-YIG nuclease family protein [Planctomycetaceae bacterium]|nr:GIY-YIG nuclease family protein [Planctomycetaceae bacterium]
MKRDLHNLELHVRKLKLDQELQSKTQESLDLKVKDLGARYLKENVKWLGSSLNAHNFASCKQRLQDVIDRCRGIGFDVPAPYESQLHTELREEYQRVVRAAFEREEQARIKAQIREEQLRQREVDRELAQLEREREAINVALEKALADARGQYSEEVERLKARLAEAEEKKRAVSQAQLTKAGHVYVISNIGSFGDGVFKVGLTRRLDPHDRVKELGSASVPFPFDVHMMISCKDAPTLECALHRKLFKLRINKANPRKEFFKTDIATIASVVKEHHGEIDYIADAEALQYRQSLEMSDEDQQFVESVYAGLDDDGDAFAEDV